VEPYAKFVCLQEENMAENPLTALGKIDPAIMQHLKDIDGLIYGDGALPRKTKLLIALAFDAAHGAANGVRALASSAMQAGATTAEISEALRVAYHLSGVGTLYTASQGLKDLV
jgi:alkylhydroperoxidase/carboxymuconolactone decarboxylase family protein YurZ